jgi:hypothetical protein
MIVELKFHFFSDTMAEGIVLPRSLMGRINLAIHERRQLSELAELDFATLRDIGLLDSVSYKSKQILVVSRSEII